MASASSSGNSRGNNWTDSETFALLDQWADETVQTELEGNPRNQAIYERIASALREHDIIRSANQCRDKIKKLKASYKKAKDNNGKTGKGRSIWKFYDIIDRVLGHRPASQPYAVIDTSSTNAGTANEEDISDDQTDLQIGDESSTNSDSQDVTGDVSESINAERSHNKRQMWRGYKRKSTPKEKDASTATPTRKRKASKVERALDDVITKFTAAQKASEKRFFEIEQKRLKQEMELEEKRMALEDKRRKQELDHEMRLMVMMTQMISRACLPYSAPHVPPPEWDRSGYLPNLPLGATMPPYPSMSDYENQSQEL